MHESDDDPENPVSNTYGILPGIAGLLIAAGLISFMFMIADGFA